MYLLGIDLGGTNISAGIADENYKIIHRESVKTLPDREPALIMRDMAELCALIADKAQVPLSMIKGAGIAAPGIVDSERGVVEYSCNLPFSKFPITEALRERLKIRNIRVENDANAAAMGEAVAGAAKDTRSSVCITLGTGVGGGVIIGGKVYSGFNFAGAELGHMVIEYNGRTCACGRKGCWEAYSSATGLINMTKERVLADRASLMYDMVGGDIGKIDGRTAFNAMRRGDSAAAEVVVSYITYLGCGICNVINIFQPEVLCIGGGVSNEGNALIEPLLKIVDREQYSRNLTAKTKICIAALGNDAGIIGAAAIAMKA